MVNRVYIELPKYMKNGRSFNAPPKHAIYHFNNNGKKTSISANYLYGRYSGNGLPPNRNYLRYFNIHNNPTALKRARFVVSHVLNNRLRRNSINKGHAGQIKFFAALYKNLYRNNKGNVNIRPLQLFNERQFTENNKKALNSAIANLAHRHKVSPNAIRSSNAARHAYYLSFFANRGNRAGVSGALLRTKYLLSKMPTVQINSTNSRIKKNTVLAKLMNNYYHGYSGVRAPNAPPRGATPKQIENFEIATKAYQTTKTIRKKEINKIVNRHLESITAARSAAAGGNNGRAAGGAQRQRTSPNRRAGRANTETSWRRKA